MQKLKDFLSELSNDDLFDLVFKDSLTGAYNRLAFEMTANSPMALVDLDSLKYINDNTSYRIGDKYLIQLVRLLKRRFDKVYRLGGDEFIVIDSDKAKLINEIEAILLGFPCFSYGIGDDLKHANADLKMSKHLREFSGARAAQGKRPSWFGSNIV